MIAGNIFKWIGSLFTDLLFLPFNWIRTSIATQDLGKTYDDGNFEILGRFDHSDIRGCNLMAL